MINIEIYLATIFKWTISSLCDVFRGWSQRLNDLLYSQLVLRLLSFNLIMIMLFNSHWSTDSVLYKILINRCHLRMVCIKDFSCSSFRAVSWSCARFISSSISFMWSIATFFRSCISRWKISRIVIQVSEYCIKLSNSIETKLQMDYIKIIRYKMVDHDKQAVCSGNRVDTSLKRSCHLWTIHRTTTTIEKNLSKDSLVSRNG